ncbi:MAG TPA: hypothetical protein VG326_20445 [Tepidisphaeraceae bacterium]|jgi:hypothetical protein|nr:hypothetical protein [Tepidisphaeraceae bacterium]
MAQATFYTVNGPRGEYYAVRNHDTEKIWTERTESAAQQQARDEGLEFVGHETIDHVRLLDMMIAVPFTPTSAPVAAVERGRMNLQIESGLSRFFRRLRGSSKETGREVK